MLNKIKGLVKEEQGQGMTEYGLVLGVIAVGVVATLVLLRGQIVQLFKNVLTDVSTATTNSGTAQ